MVKTFLKWQFSSFSRLKTEKKQRITFSLLQEMDFLKKKTFAEMESQIKTLPPAQLSPVAPLLG